MGGGEPERQGRKSRGGREGLGPRTWWALGAWRNGRGATGERPGRGGGPRHEQEKGGQQSQKKETGQTERGRGGGREKGGQRGEAEKRGTRSSGGEGEEKKCKRARKRLRRQGKDAKEGAGPRETGRYKRTRGGAGRQQDGRHRGARRRREEVESPGAGGRQESSSGGKKERRQIEWGGGQSGNTGAEVCMPEKPGTCANRVRLSLVKSINKGLRHCTL
ncbi:hypothetical protein HNY73_010333 [Argiope bruennichi]|uniref:Uncharacterized protein n=1 Tax=Argiope bruennichi TaxID=94029 RepID=A0A8T0F2Z4_ARGBR|nr:hypothetical protein HNY73_010333 [Argiope bruennichi]